MGKPIDLWHELTRTVVELIRDLQAEGERRSPAAIADAALSAFADEPDIESHRRRLEEFVRDISNHD
jgi:hypothetical protein